MNIDRKSALPLYYQLKEVIKEEIDIGKYKPGDRIPSENEFSAMLGISRNTSKQAIADLVSEGILYRVQGKGTFVAEKQSFRGLTETFSFSSEFEPSEFKFTTKVIFAEEVTESRETLEYLKLKESTELFRVQRLRYLNNIPVALQTSYIPKFFCPDLLSHNLAEESLYEILLKNGNASYEYFTEKLTCIKADKYEAELLKMKKGAPVFFLTRKTFTKNDEILEVVRSFMPGDRCEFFFKHGKEGSVELNHLSEKL